MMREEILDKNSGAIIFKKSKDAINLETALKRIKLLEDRCEKLENHVNELLKKGLI